MAAVKLVGWREGFDKVAFTKLLVEQCSLGFKGAKEKTDRFLDGAIITVVPFQAPLFKEQVRELGAIVEGDPD